VNCVVIGNLVHYRESRFKFLYVNCTSRPKNELYIELYEIDEADRQSMIPF
jgi:hypothetical protein